MSDNDRAIHPSHSRNVALIGVFVICAFLGGYASAGVEESGLFTVEEAQQLVRGLSSRVEELRGLEFKQPVEVQVVDDDHARDYMLQRFREFQSEEDLRWEQRAYYLLGILEEEIDVLDAYLGFLREQVGGYYDPAGKSFYLLDDMPRAFTTRLAIPHELTHALDDQHFNLEKLLRKAMQDDDLMFAHAAVHEGSATLLMQLHAMKAMLDGEMTLDDLQALSDADELWAEQLEGFPEPLLRPLLGSYLLGAGFLTQGDVLSIAVDGFPVEAVNRAFERGPRSSEQVLHPEKYWNEATRDDPTPVHLGNAGRALGKPFKRRAEGVLGELMIGTLVGAPTPRDPSGPSAMIGSSWTNAAAAGWDGDRWELWSAGERTVALLGSVWDGDDDALEFAAALDGHGRLTTRVCGAAVATVAGDAGDTVDALLDRMLARLGCEGGEDD
jgi:hypothetical protein